MSDAQSEFSVCLVTHPLSKASEPAIAGLMEVIGAVAEVSLVTANLPESSDVRTHYEVVEIADSGTGASIVTSAFRFLRNQWYMAKTLRDRDEDIVLFFGAVSYLLPILVAKASGKRVIVEPRGNVPESLLQIWQEHKPTSIAYLLSRLVWLLERIGYIVADAVIALSPAMADDLDLRRFEYKLYEHGARPVDVERFEPRVPYEERPATIGYLGRLDEEKGVDTLIEVVRHLPEDVDFVFVGEGELRDDIEAELATAIEAGRVRITGWVDHDEVPEYLASFRLLVLTSTTEGVPTTILEAMACGTPPCSTPVGGVVDVIEDGKTGFHLTEDSPEAMAERIESILREENLASVSDAARNFVLDRYSFGTVASRYETVFEAVTDR